MSGIRVNEWLHNSGTGGIWQTSAGNVGIASSVPTTKLEVTGDAKISGVTTATTFAPTEGQTGRRRININGAMQVAQRGTSAATANSSNEGYSTLDRWYLLYSSGAGGAITFSQDTTVPTDYTWGRFSNSIKLDVTTADTSIAVEHAVTLQYRIEAQDMLNCGWDYTNSSSTLTVSFWARSVKAGTYCVFLFSQDGTQRCNVKEYTLTANTWKHVELEFPGDSTVSFDDNADAGLYIGWCLQAGAHRYEGVTAGQWISRTDGNNQGRYATSGQCNFLDSTSNDFYLTGVQVEVGSPTRFEFWSYGDELLRCQRYYEQFNSDGLAEAPFGVGYFESDTHLRAVVPLHEKRANVSFDSTSASTFSAMNTNNMPAGSAISLYKTGKKAAILSLVLSSDVTSGDGRAGILCAQSSTEATLKFDSEL